VMGLQLTAQDMAALEGRTEGWIAALQLAALSMQGRDDVAGFIAGFAGDDRYVVDYLVEEVVQRQSDLVQTFLLQTSILGRLTGALCDAVTGQGGGKAMLEALDRGNLFLVPLDDRRRWYRYHHLFADVLHARLLDERPDEVPDLHRRASTWYEQNGEQTVAIQHALAAEDFERAATLVELAMPAMRRERREATLRSWLEMLPDELLRIRPVLSVAYVGALMQSLAAATTGQQLTRVLERIEACLQDAERLLAPTADVPGGPETPSTAMVVVDEAEFRRLPAALAVYRAAQALVLGDVAGTMTHARRALGLVGADDHLERGAAAGLLGLAHWTRGELEAAHESYVDSSASLQRAGHIADVIGIAISLADIRVAEGRLREAMRTYEQALQLARERGGSVLPGTADMHVGIGALHRERDDLPAATQQLLRSQELGEHNGLPQNPYRWRVAMARVREAEGDLEAALDLLNDAERVYVGDFAPNVRPVPAWRARVWVAQGRLDDVFGWAREQGLSVEDDLSYLREFEHVTLAKAMVAHGRIADPEPSIPGAAEFLGRLLQAAEAGGRTGSVIEILVLQALAHQVQGDLAAALVPLERALTLAEPEGYVRVFVDEGGPMAVLLEAAVERGVAPSYVRRLRKAFGSAEASTTALGETTTATQGLIEPLSERERDVLRLLGSDLGGPDIARELVVSLNTVRTHTKNIYAKLGVNNRRAAVRRAEELDLMRPRRSGKQSPS
jgi:LuxR family maltose regulon positive regulatory protein